MIEKRSLKYCLIAPSGSGKSTVAKLMGEYFLDAYHLTCETVKLAYPLYKIQEQFYHYARIKIKDSQQNHFLLESIAKNLRTLNPQAIINDFLERYNSIDSSVVINDDLRDKDVDFEILKNLGFKTVFVTASYEIRKHRLSDRGDLLVSATSELDKNFLDIKPDIIIENNNQRMDELRVKVKELVDNEILMRKNR